MFSIIILIVITIITFFISRVLPGDPVSLWVGDHPTQEQITNAKRELGLDKPLLTQFINYSRELFKGELGTSIRTRQPIISELKSRFFATFELVTISIIISISFGYPLLISGVLVFIAGNVDYYVVDFLLKEEALGFYWMAYQISHYLFFIRTGINKVLYPTLAKIGSFSAVSASIFASKHAFFCIFQIYKII